MVGPAIRFHVGCSSRAFTEGCTASSAQSISFSSVQYHANEKQANRLKSKWLKMKTENRSAYRKFLLPNQPACQCVRLNIARLCLCLCLCLCERQAPADTHLDLRTRPWSRQRTVYHLVFGSRAPGRRFIRPTGLPRREKRLRPLGRSFT